MRRIGSNSVIPAGIAGIQWLWMAGFGKTCGASKMYTLNGSTDLRPCILDSGNPCRNDGRILARGITSDYRPT
jgi:hypothetical protein